MCFWDSVLKGIWVLPLVFLLDHLREGSQSPCHDNTQASLRWGPRGEELKLPANSQQGAQCTCHQPSKWQSLKWMLQAQSGLPGGSDSKESTCNVGNPGSIPALGRYPGGGNGYPLQYSCLENSMDRAAWWAIVCGVAESWTQLSN